MLITQQNAAMSLTKYTYHRIRAINLASFSKKCEELWQGAERLPLQVPSSLLPFLAMYIACLVTSIQLMGSADLLSLGYNEEQRVQLTHHWWFNVGVKCLAITEWRGLHSLEHLQGYL